MFYRRKYYRVKKEFVESFNELFNNINLPSQLAHGSRLVGRWMCEEIENTVEIFAIWEYDSYQAYVDIESNVRNDKQHVKKVNDWYEQHGGKEFVQKKFFVKVKNEEIISTIKKVDG